MRNYLEILSLLAPRYYSISSSPVSDGARCVRWIEDMGVKNRYVLDVWAGG
jgi:sulfite reductase alpha subunit-like flavoprotein